MKPSQLLRSQWDRIGAVVAALGGAIALLVGWIGISDEGVVAAQLPYILSGGLFGIFLLGVGATLWLSADLRDEWRELYQLRVAEQELLEHLAGGEQAVATVEPPTAEIVTVANGRAGRTRRAPVGTTR